MTAPEPNRTRPHSAKASPEAYKMLAEARELVIVHGLGVLPADLRADLVAASYDRHGQKKHPGLKNMIELGASLLLAEIKRNLAALGVRSDPEHGPRETSVRTAPAATVDALTALGKEAEARASGDAAKQAEAMRELAEAEERLRKREEFAPKQAPVKKRRGR